MNATCPASPKLPPGVLEEGILRIDWTGFAKIRECYRKAWHELAWRRVLGGWDPAKGFGAAVHAGLDVRQKALMEGGGDNEALQAAIEASVEKAFEGVVLDEDDHRTLGRAKETLALYCERWPGEREDFEIVASEQVGEKELGIVVWEPTFRDEGGVLRKERRTCRVIWQGRVDGIWRDDTHLGRLVVKDTKTTSRLYDLDRKWKEFKLSPQWRMYCWLFGAPGEILDAVLDLIVVRPPLKKRSSSSRPDTEFHRLPLTYTPELLAETRRDVLKEIAAWLTACGHYSEPPAMTGAPLECTWTQLGCPYLSVCTNNTERERMAWLLGGNFVDNVWNPMREETPAGPPD